MFKKTNLSYLPQKSIVLGRLTKVREKKLSKKNKI